MMSSLPMEMALLQGAQTELYSAIRQRHIVFFGFCAVAHLACALLAILLYSSSQKNVSTGTANENETENENGFTWLMAFFSSVLACGSLIHATRCCGFLCCPFPIQNHHLSSIVAAVLLFLSGTTLMVSIAALRWSFHWMLWTAIAIQSVVFALRCMFMANQLLLNEMLERLSGANGPIPIMPPIALAAAPAPTVAPVENDPPRTTIRTRQPSSSSSFSSSSSSSSASTPTAVWASTVVSYPIDTVLVIHVAPSASLSV